MRELRTYGSGRGALSNGRPYRDMWGMGLFWLLVIIVLILTAAAFIKYLRS